jgi:bacteriocin-like protein
MTNDMNIELTDEQLAEVTGGKTTTTISQLAGNFISQANLVNGSTNVFAIGGGKNSTNELLVRGSSNNVGNSATALNIISA